MLRLKKINEDLIYIILILAAAVLMARPLFSNNLIYSHDSVSYFYCAVSTHQSWTEGDLLARWIPHLNYGYGFPFLNFYPPLFSYIASFFMFFFPIVLGFHIAIFFCLFFSGISMYLFAREIWGKEGGLLSSIAYLFAPYHILDIYVRGAVGEATAFIFFPLILLAFYRLSRRVVVRDIFIGILSIAGLLLAHPASTLMFIPWAFVYAVFSLLVQRHFDPCKTAAIICVFAGAFLLTAYFILPSMLEQRFIQAEKFLEFDYRDYFIRLGQIFYSTWRYGNRANDNTFNMSYMVGPIHLLAALAVILFWRKTILVVKGVGWQILFFLIFFLVSIYFTSHASIFWWKLIPRLEYVQFPWRFLVLATLALSFLSGGVALFFSHHLRKIVVCVVSVVLISFNLSFCRSLMYLKVGETRSSETFVRQLYIAGGAGFLPKWVKDFTIPNHPEKIQVMQGAAQVIDEGGRPLDRRFRVNAFEPATLRFHSYYFPGWEVFVNGKPVQIDPNNPFGLIDFEVPPGDSVIRVHFGSTLVRQLGEAISLFSLLALALVFAFRKKIDTWLARVQ
jgi:Predicted integral membrane protein